MLEARENQGKIDENELDSFEKDAIIKNDPTTATNLYDDILMMMELWQMQHYSFWLVMIRLNLS